MAGDLTFRQSTELALVTGLVSLVLAGTSGIIAYLRAKSDFGRELEKINAQIAAQQKAEEMGKIADLRQRYLTPLRYYAHTLSNRFAELETKFLSNDMPRVKGWFKTIKDHVTGDLRDRSGIRNYGGQGKRQITVGD